MGFIMSFVSITRPNCGKVGIAGLQGASIIQQVVEKFAVSSQVIRGRFRHWDSQHSGHLNADYLRLGRAPGGYQQEEERHTKSGSAHF